MGQISVNDKIAIENFKNRKDVILRILHACQPVQGGVWIGFHRIVRQLVQEGGAGIS